jgi:class 3 adenylate cyclase
LGWFSYSVEPCRRLELNGGVMPRSHVFVSSTVKDLTAGSGLVFEDAGEHELKGVPERWRLYRVVSG